MLTNNTDIELLVAGRIIKARVNLILPEMQVWLLNTKPTKLEVDVTITPELERLACYAVSSMNKIKRDNAMLMR